MNAGSKQRGMFFIDGSNFYHSLKARGIAAYALDLTVLARSLLGNRPLASVHYYTARVNKTARSGLYAAQQRYLQQIEAQGINISLGYLQKRRFRCPACKYNRVGIPCNNCGHEFGQVEEKGVDVNIAVDMVYFAALDRYDVAYLISSDGDFAGACEKARSLGKRVYYVCCSQKPSLALKSSCNHTIYKHDDFFDTCRISRVDHNRKKNNSRPS